MGDGDIVYAREGGTPMWEKFTGKSVDVLADAGEKWDMKVVVVQYVASAVVGTRKVKVRVGNASETHYPMKDIGDVTAGQVAVAIFCFGNGVASATPVALALDGATAVDVGFTEVVPAMMFSGAEKISVFDSEDIDNGEDGTDAITVVVHYLR